MLVETTLRTCAEYLTIAQREETAEHWEQTYHSLVLRRKLRTVVCWITKRETGSVLQPGDRCTKTGELVMEVLRAQTPGGLDTNRGEPGLVHRLTPGANTDGHHQ